MRVGNNPLRVVANQMMKGIAGGRYAPSSTVQTREAYLEKHKDLIAKILEHMPRTSLAISAVICKCALKYGEEKAIRLADSLRTGMFTGANDPAHLLWQYMLKPRGKDTSVYRYAVCAARAFCEGRNLIHHLRPSETDIDS